MGQKANLGAKADTTRHGDRPKQRPADDRRHTQAPDRQVAGDRALRPPPPPIKQGQGAGQR